MPTELSEHAKSSQDYYGLLEVQPTITGPELGRAWRRATLKYHPDKNPGTDAVEKWHLLQVAYDVLSDETARGIYDQARKAKAEKAVRESAFDERRRQMKEDLERRERQAGVRTGTKRSREEVEVADAEEAQQREIRRIQEDNRRRMRERADRMRKEQEDEQARLDELNRTAERGTTVEEAKTSHAKGGTEVAEMQRSVKVAWNREIAQSETSLETIKALFSRFGDIEASFALDDKKKRVDGKKTRLGRGVVVFRSIVGAHAAVQDRDDPMFAHLESIDWAEGKAPDCLRESDGPANAASGPSFEELAMIRFRTAEKKRREEKKERLTSLGYSETMLKEASTV